MISARTTRPHSMPALLAAVVALALAGVAAPARADLVIEVLNATAGPGGSGSFDIVLVDNGGTFQVGGFTVEPTVSPVSGVTFTGADTLPVAAPYIFGTYQSAPLPFATDPADPSMPATFPNTDFIAGDTDLTAPGFVTLNPGDMVGLAHVTFAVAPGTAPGTAVPVSLAGGGNTSLADVNGDPIAFTTVNGTITVTAVPEPSSLALFGLGLAGAVGCARRRRVARD